jgi:hypothetical protein
MSKYFGSVRAAALCALSITAPFCLAVDTHVWQQNEQAEFERGTAKNISIRSDGRVTLAPAFKELLDAGVPYLWTVTQDSKGTLYCAGGAPTGATTKIFAVAPGGKSKTFAELTGLEVHVLAVDSKDRLYAAVLPDAKIYRIDSSGKSELFFDTKQKYVWAMAFDRAGNLFVATGDQGVIYKVAPDGKGTEFFKTEEIHARSLIVDTAGDLIVGTEPSGLVLRISPQATSFVLFQTAKKEVTAVAERDGVIYAASVGQKTAGPAVGPAPAPAGAAPAAPGGATIRITTAPTAEHAAAATTPPPNLAFAANAVSGGSEFYRIEASGFAEKLWASNTEVIYAVGFDAAGKPLLGTGNKGVIYRVDSDLISTQLLSAGPTQVTDFATGRDGVVYAVTGNVGKLYSIGPGYEQSGSLESEVLDAGSFTYWGKAHLKDELHGGSVGLETRSGNLSRPQKNWSEWKKAAVGATGGQVDSPAARFLQYRLTLSQGGQNETPTVSEVEVAYQQKNVAPRVRQIEVGPTNYRTSGGMNLLERSTQPSGSPSSLTLPPVGQRRGNTPTPVDSGAAGSGVTLQYAKGFITARWSASDENGDPLTYKVEIRGKSESGWHLLKETTTEKQFSWDGSSFPDGEYVLRVTASDAPGNTPADALSASLESDPFTIDNTPPEILNGKVTNAGGHSVITFTAKDALSWVDKTEYSIDGGEWTLLDPVNRVSDSQTLDFKLALPAGSGTARVVAIRVFDDDDNVVVTRYLAP